MLIRTKHLLKIKKTMNEILSRHTGQPIERVEKDTDRDNFMSAAEARDYGLVDHVLERLPPGQIPVRTEG
jgi:ATP-dependent Clp protease protease subunit